MPDLATATRGLEPGDLATAARALATAGTLAEIRAAAAQRDKRHEMTRLHDRQAKRLTRGMLFLQCLAAALAETAAEAALAPELELVAPLPGPREPEPELPFLPQPGG